jgi:hypothetical protein
MTIEIIWSAYDDGVYIAKQQTTLLVGDWAASKVNAADAVRKVCEDFFRPDIWHEWIGSDEARWRVIIDVHSPPSIAGSYAVVLERVTRAQVYKIETAGKR